MTMLPLLQPIVISLSCWAEEEAPSPLVRLALRLFSVISESNSMSQISRKAMKVGVWFSE
jgi:hypothetical protein